MHDIWLSCFTRVTTGGLQCTSDLAEVLDSCVRERRDCVYIWGITKRHRETDINGGELGRSYLITRRDLRNPDRSKTTSFVNVLANN